MMSLYNYTIEYETLKSFDQELMLTYNIIPLYYKDLFLFVATSNPDLDSQQISKIFNHPVKLILIPHHELQFEHRYYKIKTKLYYLSKAMENNLTKKETSKEVIEFIHSLLEFAIDHKVSDIHCESIEKGTIIRLRIDGVLHQFFRFNTTLLSIISSYMKYLSNLDISQKRLPLNSRFSKTIKDITYDFRISTLPTIFGESIVIRILNNKDTQKKLEDIGFTDNTLNMVQKILQLKQGLFLVTGPTGSGKTTTLYSMIQKINSLEKKIITIEDPVEYKIEGIIQVNINEELGLNYNKILKNILRQDPDILFIGEIRDKESLKIALQASLTGHLVLATLHTNNAMDTIFRLLDLEAEPFLITATLKGILSQRLVRILCKKCKTKQNQSYIAKGCKNCNYSGYQGRQIICEFLQIDEKLKDFIINKPDKHKIEQYLNNISFSSLQMHCSKLINEGLTTKEEFFNKV